MNNIITCEHWAMELTINPDTGRIDSVEIITTDSRNVCIDLDVTELTDGWWLTGCKIRKSGYDDFDELKEEINAAHAAAQHFQTIINAIQHYLAA